MVPRSLKHPCDIPRWLGHISPLTWLSLRPSSRTDRPIKGCEFLVQCKGLVEGLRVCVLNRISCFTQAGFGPLYAVYHLRQHRTLMLACVAFFFFSPLPLTKRRSEISLRLLRYEVTPCYCSCTPQVTSGTKHRPWLQRKKVKRPSRNSNKLRVNCRSCGGEVFLPSNFFCLRNAGVSAEHRQPGCSCLQRSSACQDFQIELQLPALCQFGHFRGIWVYFILYFNFFSPVFRLLSGLQLGR